MYLLGHKLPQLRETAVVESAPTRRRRRVRTETRSNPWAPTLLFAFMIALMLGILGFEYMTYSLPPDKVVESAADSVSIGDFSPIPVR